jgi:hypothetical protein
MKKMMLLMLVFCLGIPAGMNAQVRVGGLVDPNPNALLDVNKDTITVTGNNTGGLALPRVALTSTTVATPVGTKFVKGMLVYNTATAGTAPNNVTPGAYYSDGAKWIRVSGSDAPIAGWQLSGNAAGTNNFIGYYTVAGLMRYYNVELTMWTSTKTSTNGVSGSISVEGAHRVRNDRASSRHMPVRSLKP